VILQVLGWLAMADAIAAAILAGLIYIVGRRSAHQVGGGRCVGLAIFFGLPATLLYLMAWLVSRMG
jgi:hypothetical protein